MNKNLIAIIEALTREAESGKFDNEPVVYVGPLKLTVEQRISGSDIEIVSDKGKSLFKKCRVKIIIDSFRDGSMLIEWQFKK